MLARCELSCYLGMVLAHLSIGTMEALREARELVQKAPTVVAPMTLGFGDCFALLLGLVLMLISAVVPERARS